MCRWLTIMAERERERNKTKQLKSPEMMVKQESEKVGLKLSIPKWRSWHLVPSLHGKKMGKQWKQRQALFCWAPNYCRWWLSHKIKRYLLFGRKAMTNLESVEKQRHHFADKHQTYSNYGFSSSCVWMWELEHKEVWVPKNWSFQTEMLEKNSMNVSLSKLQKMVKDKGIWYAVVHGFIKSWTQLNDWTTTVWIFSILFVYFYVSKYIFCFSFWFFIEPLFD